MRGTVKIRNSFPWLVIAILIAGGVAQAQEPVPASSTPDHAGAATETIPVSTQVVVAQRAYEMGMVQREDRLFVDEGLEFFRQAVKADPQFALGHAALAYFTSNPKEERQESALAVKFIDTASPDEQSLIG